MMLAAFFLMVIAICLVIPTIGLIAGAIIVLIKWIYQKKTALLLLSIGAFLLALIFALAAVFFIIMTHEALAYIFMW